MATDHHTALSPFVARHIGPTAGEQSSMLADLGLDSLDELIAAVVPEAIRLDAAAAAQDLPDGCGEAEAVLCEQLPQWQLTDVLSRRCEKCDGVKAQFSSRGTGCRQILVKHKRSTTSLFNEADCECAD